MLKAILFLAINNCNKKIIFGLTYWFFLRLVSVVIISVNLTFVNLNKKNSEKQINITKKVAKKNVYHNLSVKETFKKLTLF